MTDLLKVAKYISCQLKSIGYEYVTEDFTPCTSNGRSYYVYGRKNSTPVKFRISDHSCGDYRMATEININSIESAEKFFSPEQFQRIVTEEIASVSFEENAEESATKSNSYQFVENLGQVRLSKKGNPINKYKITTYVVKVAKIN